ncbi:helix-turn-helix transcriptional regulator [Alloyangia pacifica]|uniref:Helix-turn-helix transcriptional regulator n=1 Tax=Alloyangia pacifica TaxID=311180 RepID=A0A2U8HKC6_9RHOB|nr:MULTISPECIES: helix-turn-helix transcriptional regulator [Roseobacteraceae]AWI85506.1 helix-turn-helix transcriptional regulator [Alloyangia pacifica]NDV51444.1 helix-turn-helix transcriptional regulator [Salipiger sp. PrR003]NDW33466.1 helix-turn-helix transcriptional regulator [Salipiger sp. PrR007]
MAGKFDVEGWVAASTEVVSAIGTPRFPKALTAAMRAVVPFEFTVTFAYYKDRRPIDIYDDFPSAKRRVMVDDYQEGPYLLDPFYLHSAAPTTSRLVRLRELAPDRFYQAEYFRNYYVQTGLAEEIGFIVDVGDDVSVVISAMRELKAFSAREFRDFQTIFPFVEACAKRHWAGLIEDFAGQPSSEGPRLPKLIDDAFQSFGRNLLTPREAEIVEYTLKGHSAEATGHALGIAPGTVRIHRRNIYGKLGVSSQGELFSQFMASLEDL